MTVEPQSPTTSPTGTPCTFVPVPLLSGDTLDVATGVPAAVTSVRVVLTTETGQEVVVPLEWRFGGWWAPPR